MSLSNYGEGKILDHLFGKAAYTAPTLYLAVSTADPTDAGTGTTEPVGNGYARVATAPADWSRTDGVMSNAALKAFPEATGAWGVLTHFAMYDAATAGNMVAHSALGTAKSPTANDVLRFPIGTITFSLD